MRTADSGYLTRRLVDVAQELIINDDDPFERGGPVRGMWLDDIKADEAGKRYYLETRLFSRCLADDVACGDGTVLKAGTIIGEEEMNKLRDDPTVDRVRVLSPLTDDHSYLGQGLRHVAGHGGMVEPARSGRCHRGAVDRRTGYDSLTMCTSTPVVSPVATSRGLPRVVECSRPAARRTRPSSARNFRSDFA